VLLQVLDDGRLTDGQGRTVDFKNTVIIMTSNLGTELLSTGEGEARGRAQVMAAVRAHFRPEFLNRLDEIILFHRLTRANMDKIVDIQIERLSHLLADRKIDIRLDDKARHWLGDAGYDPVYGARPLKRVIQRRLQDPLAQLILEGKVGEGDTVTVSASKTGLSLNGQEFAANADELADMPPTGTALN
jgi:ATP-dependent Clp protease ATP-binding subunit ClpB